jgi:hypothetical protein
MQGQELNWKEPFSAGTRCTSVGVDSKNNLYFGGLVNNVSISQFFKSTELPSRFNSHSHGFIAKTNSDLEIEWIKEIGTNFFQNIILKIDHDDNIVLTGN